MHTGEISWKSRELLKLSPKIFKLLDLFPRTANVPGHKIEKRKTMKENMIVIKKVDRDNFSETSMDLFDRYQEVQNVFRMESGKLVLKKQPFTETWSPERKREKAAEILSGKYLTFCAFDGESVIGEIMLIPELNDNRLIIDSLHVSREYRQHGIGRQLVETACYYAKSRGAEALYASCCSAEETIRFYTAMGFEPSEHPITSCVEDEPFDIQMECRFMDDNR